MPEVRDRPGDDEASEADEVNPAGRRDPTEPPPSQRPRLTPIEDRIQGPGRVREAVQEREGSGLRNGLLDDVPM
eukprot:6907623-Pyramimonas_sp.AAC.1